MKSWDWIRGTSATLCVLFILLLVTSGWALMASYVPSDAEAFSSIVYLRQVAEGGKELRSAHYYLASGVVVLGFVYLLGTYLSGRHREGKRAWWWALAVYFLLLGICFTGYLLPMDQNAYWGTVVRLGIAETVPVMGTQLADLLRGGPVFNASSLPRFYALHVAVLPLFVLLAMAPLGRKALERFRSRGDGAVWLAVGVVALMVIYFVASRWMAPLELRADPTDSEYIPRPEWYFLWLFQFGKYVEAVPWVESLLVPMGGILLLMSLPLGRDRGVMPRVALALVWCVTWIGLTGLAVWDDRELPPKLPYEQAMLERAVSNYEDLCFECHGEEGRGDGPQSKVFHLDARDFTALEIWVESSEEQMRQAVRDGKGKDMPAYSRKLADDEIVALIDYIKVRFAPEGVDDAMRRARRDIEATVN